MRLAGYVATIESLLFEAKNDLKTNLAYWINLMILELNLIGGDVGA